MSMMTTLKISENIFKMLKYILLNKDKLT